MSLNDWLMSTIGDSTPPDFRASPDLPPGAPSPESRDVSDIHQRLDSITRQIEQISRSKPRSETSPRSETGPRGEASPRGEPGVARQLNDAISRLDARLSQISNPHPAKTSRTPGIPAQGRPGRTRRRPGLPSLAAAQPGLARLRDRGNRCAPERT